MKGNKKLDLILLVLCISILPTIAIVTLASSELSIEDISFSGYGSAIKYSDDRLLYWSNNQDTVYEDVKKYYISYDGAYEPYILKNNGTFTYTDVEGTKTKNNIKDFYALFGDEAQLTMYIDQNNTLHFDTAYEEFTLPESMPNVTKVDYDEINMTFGILSNGNLYTLLFNLQGGLDNIITTEDLYAYEPVKVAENVKDMGSFYYLTNDNKMYLYGNLLLEDIKSVKELDVSNYISAVYEITTLSNERKIIYTYIDEIETSQAETLRPFKQIINISEPIKKVINYDSVVYLLTESNDLYEYDSYYYAEDSELRKVKENVKDIAILETNSYYEDLFLYQSTNDDLYASCMDGSCYTKYFSEIFNSYYLEENKEYKLLSNVQSIEYIEDRFILMKDKSVYRFGENKNNEYRSPLVAASNSVVQIDELINNGNIFKVNQVQFKTEDKMTIGDELDLKSIVIPENAGNRAVEYTIENESIFEYDDENEIYYGKTEGVTNVCVVSKDNNTIKDCLDITIIPTLTGVEIEQGDSIEVDVYEDFKISLRGTPLNSSSPIYISYDEDLNFNYSDEYYDNEKAEYISAKENEIYLYAYSTGTYELTFFDSISGYSDTITVNVTKKVSKLTPIVEGDYDNINNAFMYLNLSNQMQLDYDYYPSTATNPGVTWTSSDPSVATIDEYGKVTAYKSGRTKITMTAVDSGNAKRTFNLIVYDVYGNAAMPGDVNEDNSVDILDVIKLRKYLAGLEDEL